MTLLYLRPIWRLWRNHLTLSLDDPLLVLYVLKWSAHQIRLGLPDLWNANLFYPTRGALTLSEHMLGPAAQLVGFELFVPNAVAGYNFLLFTSFVATALTVCWVMRRAGLSWTAAALAGWMVTFSPFRLSQMAHLQVLIAQWIPLTLWFWDRLLAKRTVTHAGLFLLFYLLHVTGGCYLAYMIHFPMLALLVNRIVIEKREILSWRSLRVLAPVAGLAATALLAIFLPYARTAKSLRLVRPAAEVWRYGAEPASYLTPARKNVYRQVMTRGLLRQEPSPQEPEKALFAGFVPTVLFLAGAFAGWRRRDGPLDPWARGLVFAGLLCFALTFAVVYVPLMRLIPGMDGMRVPARFYVFVSFVLAHFAARGVDFLRARMAGPWARAALAAVLGVLLVCELMPRPLRWMPLPREEQFPAVNRWIAREPSVRALIELPIHRDPRENLYLYYSTLHWKPLANGFSGYFPDSHRRLTRAIRFLPDEQGLELLRDYGISHLVIHAKSRLREQVLGGWEGRFAAGADREVERVYRSGSDSVYRLLDSSNSRTPKRPGW